MKLEDFPSEGNLTEEDFKIGQNVKVREYVPVYELRDFSIDGKTAYIQKYGEITTCRTWELKHVS